MFVKDGDRQNSNVFIRRGRDLSSPGLTFRRAMVFFLCERMDMEQEIGQLAVGGLAFRVFTSARRSRVGILAADGGFRVVGPVGLSLAEARRVVERNLPAVRKLAERHAALPPPAPPPEFSVGGTLRMFGRNCPVELGVGHPVYEDGVFKVHPVCAREEEFVKFYRRFAASYLAQKVRAAAAAGGVSVTGVRIGGAAGRWGSCSAEGRLNFPWKLVLCPEDLIDYVIAHELAHRKHMDHSEAFWREVARLCPEWRERRRRLRVEEQRLRSWSEVR